MVYGQLYEKKTYIKVYVKGTRKIYSDGKSRSHPAHWPFTGF